jgi:superfamily II DNA or RNA helicase
MSLVALSEKLLSDAAGWQAVKEARGIVAADRVLSSDWSPPLLRGVVQAGTTTYRAGLVIKSAIDIENLCPCRESREWGKLCAHSVAVGLHHLGRQHPTAPARPSTVLPAVSAAPKTRGQTLQCAAPDAPGEPAEIFVIFPPNFADAAARGQITLCFEGRWCGGRSPLNVLPKTQPFSFSPQDLALLDRIESLAGGDTPAMLRLAAVDFGALLPLLVGHPRVTLGKAVAVTISGAPWALPLKATLLPDGQIEVKTVELLARPPLIVAGWVFQNPILQPLGLPPWCLEALQKPVRVPRDRVPQFLNTDWPRLAAGGAVEANFTLDDFALEPLVPRFCLHLAGSLARLEAQVEVAYGERRFPCSRNPSEGAPTQRAAREATAALWLPDPQDPTRYSTRDFAAEEAAVARLARAGFFGPDAQGRLRLEGQNGVLGFFAREFPRLQREWEVTLEERLERNTAQTFEHIEPQFEVTASGVQWFDLNVSFAAPSGERLSPTDIQRLILSGQTHSRLRNGKIALIDTGAVEELQETLLDCSPHQRGGAYRIDNAQAGFLDATLRQHPGWEVQAPSAWRARARQESGDAALECPPLGELESVLRPYQKAGVAWLSFLRRNGFGGILADEMGLGKTLQVLALLHSRAGVPPASGSRDGCPTLVVCPTSLIFNWVAEAAKFTPRLRVLPLHGPDRHALFDQIPQQDLVVTSYALTRRDAEQYRGLEFDTVVLDEAQHIKNRQTQNAQAVKAIRSRHRLVLTGTPLENSVLDLWSIFDFLMPGYLGSAQDFRERYEVLITRERNAAAQERLARRLRPFLLRRLKREVAPELPARIDQVAFCELTDDQRAVYQQVLEASRKEVLDAVGAQGLARSRMVVLTALLRLRQICCDLRLLKVGQASGLPTGGDLSDARSSGAHQPPSPSPCPSPPGRGRPGPGVPSNLAPGIRLGSQPGFPLPEREGRGEGERDAGSLTNREPAGSPPTEAGGTPALRSGKLELFSELLEEILDGNHRALVFSQFTSMLALLRERLEAEDVEFCYLDGSTANRGEVVTRFQQGRAPVFLISLKAGGVGLNLTAADTVIHFDPWWNPAVEDQASDRAHRIGQRRVVTSYKLITRGTVEEKILQLQQRKREVIRATLGGEEQLAEGLTWDELQELLAS